MVAMGKAESSGPNSTVMVALALTGPLGSLSLALAVMLRGT